MKISIEEARKIYMDSLQIHLDFPLKRRTYNLSPAFQEKIKGTTVFDFASNSKEESRSIMDAVNRNNLIRDISYYQDLKYFGVDKADVYIIGDDLELHHELAFSSGYSWIGVKVDDKICAVSASDYVCKRPAPETQLQPFILLKIAVAEMLGVSGDGPRRMLPRTAHYIPIAVVSAAPSGGLTGLNEEEFEGAQRAIELIRDFFKKKLKNGLSFSSLSYQEIEQLALCALSYLMGGKFCPNKTMVQSLADMGLADWDLPLCPVKICSWGGGADGQIRGINEKDVTEAFNSLQPRSHL